MKSQVILALALIGCPIFETALCNQTNAVQSLGSRVYPAITNGIAFVEGEYIPPPYIIRRNENAILLNGRQCFVDHRWPIRPYVRPKPPTPPKERPTMPPGITAQTAYEDARVSSYFQQMRLYLFDKFGEEKGMDMMVEVYKQMPFITDAKRLDADLIRIWRNDMFTDAEFVIRQRNFPDWGAKGRARSAEDILMNVESSAQLWVGALSRGSVVLADPGNFPFGIEVLFPIADALQKADNETEFLALLPKSLSLRGLSKYDLKNFWKHREQAPVWEARAKQLHAERQEANLSREAGLEALDAYLRAAPSADALIATLQTKRPRLLYRILGKDAEGNPISSHGLFTEQELREFFKNRNNPEGWRPKPPPPYKSPQEIIETISAALAKAKTETEFRTALAGKFTDNDWRGGCSTWDKYLSFIWERRDRPRHEWSGEPSSPPVSSTNAPAKNPEQDSAFDR